MGDTIILAKAERMELERRVASRTGGAEDARRARAILLLAARILDATRRAL